METSNSWVIGVDIANEDFVVALHFRTENNLPSTRGTKTFANDKKGLKTFLTWLEKQSLNPEEGQIVLESTGIYGKALAYRAYGAGWNVVIVNPKKISAYRASYPSQGKTDSIDANLIANYGMTHLLPQWTPNETLLDQVCQLFIKGTDSAS